MISERDLLHLASQNKGMWWEHHLPREGGPGEEMMEAVAGFHAGFCPGRQRGCSDFSIQWDLVPKGQAQNDCITQ